MENLHVDVSFRSQNKVRGREDGMKFFTRVSNLYNDDENRDYD